MMKQDKNGIWRNEKGHPIKKELCPSFTNVDSIPIQGEATISAQVAAKAYRQAEKLNGYDKPMHIPMSRDEADAVLARNIPGYAARPLISDDEVILKRKTFEDEKQASYLNGFEAAMGRIKRPLTVAEELQFIFMAVLMAVEMVIVWEGMIAPNLGLILKIF